MKMYNDMPEDTTTYRVEIETDEDNPNQLTVCLKSYTNADVWGYNSDTCGDWVFEEEVFKDELSAVAHARKLAKDNDNCEIVLHGNEVSKEEIRTSLYIDDTGLTSRGYIELTFSLEKLIEKFIGREIIIPEHEALSETRIDLMEFIDDQVRKQS
tara:strand:+ start:37 stop:501 length:465 start_codon:yes stop_codon:yes gene_type:complete